MVSQKPSDEVVLAERPEGIEIILSLSSEAIVTLEDLTQLLSIQYKLHQYALYINQQLAQAKAELNDLEYEFNDLLYELIADIKPKSLSLTEKRAIAMKDNPTLAAMDEEVREVRRRRTELEGWSTDVSNMAEVVKQVYYRVRRWTYSDDNN